MSTISKKELQQANNKDDLIIKPLDKQSKKNYQTYKDKFGFGKNKWYSNKINFEIISYVFVRFVIVVVTAITLMELERVL